MTERTCGSMPLAQGREVDIKLLASNSHNYSCPLSYSIYSINIICHYERLSYLHYTIVN